MPLNADPGFSFKCLTYDVLPIHLGNQFVENEDTALKHFLYVNCNYVMMFNFQ